MAEQRRYHHYHPAVDCVMKVLGKASEDLSLVLRHVDQEFRRSYPDQMSGFLRKFQSAPRFVPPVRPCKLVARIKKVQEEVVSLKELCRQLLAEKQVINE